MSTYELDDDLVRAWIHFTANEVAGEEVKLREAFEKQLPLPVPTKIGAVVRTAEGVAVLVDVHMDPVEASTWVMTGADGYSDLAGCDLGRITEVLFEGVDL